MTSTQPPQNPTLKPPPLSIPQPPPLLLTIRFSTAIPDLELDIPRPSTTTVISLKRTIRQRLSEPNSQRRLRFIHGGKILPDSAALSSVLRAPLPPPPSSPSLGLGLGYPGDSKGKGTDHHSNNSNNASGKGKSIPGRPDPSQRIYVNCSIGDSLTTAELQTEATQAAAPAPPSPLLPPSPSGTPLPSTPLPSTTAAPRGFDRLLSAGFSAAEVNQLRLQFRSIQSSRYTPDTLPSPDGFRRMEDAWIDDNGASVPTTSLSSPGGAGGTDSDDVGLVALVDVMIRGVMTGFMWPLGSAGWLVREEGMASGRWRFMVGVGVVFSVLIGIIRSISGEK
ncbi:DUF2407 C-terminal domain-containing protein [Annulohypoxylon maeteangense]|uniref:DUF2407 C-terminal domain-containing protein n=1 Tax=Annulohypoxylon maeteangense TaxID=1927788 RepID=UPI002007351B|nr:DUF2407 C-terminal domain-containing protein [Annulohypoxylon maeteangense]KAI0884630.1 DUF2407 C-terminal domain-containing protein [Annulohypoxylon maeteangense]